MTTQVRSCPRCHQLMWVKKEQIEYPTDDTMRVTCPHCQHAVTLKLVTEGDNASGPKMGH